MKINHKNRFWIWAILFILIALSVVRYERFAGKRHYGDFHVYYVTGERLLNRSEIYIEQEETITPFKYSPIVASWFALLAILPEVDAANIWHIFNLGLLFACFYLSWIALVKTNISFSQNSSPHWQQVIFIALICIAPPILHCVNSGQVGLAIAFFYYLGIYFMICDQPVKSAFSFALSAMFKFLPLMILPYLLFRRKFKLAAWFIFAFLFFHGMPAIWLGWDLNLHYLKTFIPHITATTLDHVSLLDFKNQSVWAYLYRLIYYDFGIFQIAAHSEWLVRIGGGLFVLIYALLLFKKYRNSHFGTLIDLSVLGILMVIFNPNAWKHNFVLFILPCVILSARCLSRQKIRLESISLTLIAVAFMFTNRSVFGWALRHEMMSLSVLPIASLILILALFKTTRTYYSLLEQK